MKISTIQFKKQILTYKNKMILVFILWIVFTILIFFNMSFGYLSVLFSLVFAYLQFNYVLIKQIIGLNFIDFYYNLIKVEKSEYSPNLYNIIYEGNILEKNINFQQAIEISSEKNLYNSHLLVEYTKVKSIYKLILEDNLVLM